MRRSGGVVRGVLFVVALLGVPTPAFTLPIGELESQAQALRERNQMIRVKLDRQKVLTQQLKQRIDNLDRKDEAIADQVRQVTERPAGISAPLEIVPTSKLMIKVLGDFGYTYYAQDNDTFDNAFWVARQDLFFSGAISERISALFEMALLRETFTPNVPEPLYERAFVNYRLSDALNVRAGLMHTPLGYWSDTFLHAAWLQTSVFEPEIYASGQNEMLGNRLGGWLPIHTVGVDVSGTLALPGADVGYNVGLFNGRSQTLNRRASDVGGFGGISDNDPLSSVADQNDFKAINARLSLSPAAFLGGLKLGAGLYIDEIPPELDTSTGTPAAQRFSKGISETMVSLFLAYHQGPAELLGETFYIRHHRHDINRSYGSWAHYLQAGYKVREKYTPYYRFDYIDFGNGDPFWDQIDFDVAKHTVGLRWDVSDWNALKLEYSHAGNQGIEDEQQVVVNSSWVF